MSDRPMYARFCKCDLHMHTLLDHHWREDSTQLHHTVSDKGKHEVARAYLKACHDAGLKIIAITDHNFAPLPEQSFINWLRDENKLVAQEVGCFPLIIFSGFEVEADVGKGCHVLCLFSPDIPLSAEGHIKRLRLATHSQPEPAVGALDVPAVKRAVQDIMEGSEEAFRRRREKYGF